MGNLTASNLLKELTKEKQTQNKQIINIINGGLVNCDKGTSKQIIHEYICNLIGTYTDNYITKQMAICGYTLTNEYYNCKIW